MQNVADRPGHFVSLLYNQNGRNWHCLFVMERSDLSIEANIAPACPDSEVLVAWQTAFSLFDSCSFALFVRLVSDVSGSSVAERVKKGITPFLRCAALFFNCLTGVHPPEELFSAAGESHLSFFIIIITCDEWWFQADILDPSSCFSRTDGGTVLLLGITLQFVPALPRAQRFCYFSAAKVGDKY